MEALRYAAIVNAREAKSRFSVETVKEPPHCAGARAKGLVG